MKRKNGFTLIELLAVIIILAVIALIAVPQVIKILSQSKKAAFENSVNGLFKSSDNYIANFMLKNDGSIPEKLEFECNKDGCNLTDESKENLKNYNLNNLEKLKKDYYRYVTKHYSNFNTYISFTIVDFTFFKSEDGGWTVWSNGNSGFLFQYVARSSRKCIK